MKTIPFVMITVENSRGKMEDAAKLGSHHYLVKPFNAGGFDAKINEVLYQPVSEKNKQINTDLLPPDLKASSFL